jgi:hypothetical protein
MLWAPTVTEELHNDVRFAFRFKVGKRQQPLTDIERDMVADAYSDLQLTRGAGAGPGWFCGVGAAAA